jgi:hypothetical protein
MPAEILRNAKVQIASFDFGNLCRSCTINRTFPTQEVTGMGDTDKTYVFDIPEWSVTIDFFDSFEDNGLNEMLWTWAGTTQAFKARKDDSAISAANPEFQGNVLITAVPVFQAAVGQVAGGQLTLQGSGTITRAVA